jgi:hypothetical protein
MSRSFSREELSDSVLNPRLVREQAHTGNITASLIWNGKSDLDLHAKVQKASGGPEEHICHNRTVGTGGELDVDANCRDNEVHEEPVENIFWKAPPDGKYVISVQNYKSRGVAGKVAFRVKLRLPNETLDYEGQLEPKKIANCFAFSVEDGKVTMGTVTAPSRVTRRRSARPVVGRVPGAMKAMKAMKAPKAMLTVIKKTKAPKGTKNQKAKVFQGKFSKTGGGLKKDHLTKNKKGKIVSIKDQERGKRQYERVRKWGETVKKVRTDRAARGKVSGFLLRKGGSFYKEAKEAYSR